VSEWNKESVYDTQIGPLMAHIIATCKAHGIPCAATFQYGEDNDGAALYCTTVIPGPDSACGEWMRDVQQMLRSEAVLNAVPAPESGS
jgi:hypothetical protein